MTLNNPNNIHFNSFSGVLVAINTEFPNTNNLPSSTKQCNYSASLCVNYGLPGHTCFNRQSKGVFCNASVDFPYISSLNSIACTSDDPDYQLKGCPTVGANIILTGHYFNQSGSISKSVKVGGVLCPYSSWTSTEIVCNLPPGIGANHEVNVTAANGNSNVQLDNRKQLVSFSPPNMSHVSPQPGTTRSELTTFHGKNFGTTPSPITITIDNQL